MIMRPPAADSHEFYNTRAAAAADAGSGIRNLNSPTPHLYAALALLLGLIAMALIVLACSCQKSAPTLDSSSGGTSATDELHEEISGRMVWPTVAVIMAGDDNPTRLAKPGMPASSGHKEQL